MSARKANSTDAAWQQKLSIRLTPTVWRSVVAALHSAQSHTSEDRFVGLIPRVLGKIEPALSKFDAQRTGGQKPNYEKGEPNLCIEGTIFGWVTLADLLLVYGDRTAKNPAGLTMVHACQNALRGGIVRDGSEEEAVDAA